MFSSTFLDSEYYSTSFAPVTTDFSLTAHQQMSGRSSVLAEQRDTTHSMHCQGNSWGSLDWKTAQNRTGVLHTKAEELDLKKEVCSVSVIRIRYKCYMNLSSGIPKKEKKAVPVVGYDGQYPE